MPLEQELLAAGFVRDGEIVGLDQAQEYGIRLSDQEKYVFRISPSDMLNGWWYSRLDTERETFDAVIFPIGLSWLSRELQRCGDSFEWWRRPARGFYKNHPWMRNCGSRVFAGSYVPSRTVTKPHESFPGTVERYLAEEPFAVRGVDPRPVVAADAAKGQEQSVIAVIQKRMDDAFKEMTRVTFDEMRQLDLSAFSSGRLNVREEIDRMAREIASRKADELFVPPVAIEEPEGYGAALNRRRSKRQKKQEPEQERVNPLLITGRKIDL